MQDKDYDAVAQLDGKVADLAADGFDVGEAVGDVNYTGTGAYRRHKDAVVCAHPVFGPHAVHGAIAGHWVDVLGGPEGGWGYPLTDEYADGEGRARDFQGGSLFWTHADGVLEIRATGPAGDSPDVDWTKVGALARLAYAVGILVDRYHYPVNGAAGMVGNLWAESGVLPSRIEGSSAAKPTRARDFAGTLRDFSPEEIMRRDPAARKGPRLPGVGLAQWTSRARRAGLFKHDFDGQVLGAAALFNMDAQLDYLAVELKSRYPGVHAVLANPAVSVKEASDDVVYRYEVPGAILSGGTKLPRNDPRVQAVFRVRRAHSVRALKAYRSA
ncbi:phage tail tip lysozyme [Streptomyces sp. NPDC047043]|uniref:phage tail tip lysozyme n=1 Tax=Streptomyces sp. NPDC047043 TaxID=3154497 RepID=UPI00340BD43E